MIRTPDSLLLRDLFLEHGFEYQIAAKQYATHHLMQDWQFNFLFNRGLKPHHNFLDIGCGWLRLAQALLPYLESGRYFGIDAVQTHLDIGREFLRRTNTPEVRNLLCNTEFAFDRFETQFDFAISHAVFTHLTHEQIRQCMRQLVKVMKPGGRCYCTFYRAREDRDKRTVYQLADSAPLEFGSAHITVDYFSQMLSELDLTWEYLGRCKHPTGQHVIEITFGPRVRPALRTTLRRSARAVRRHLQTVLGE